MSTEKAGTHDSNPAVMTDRVISAICSSISLGFAAGVMAAPNGLVLGFVVGCFVAIGVLFALNAIVSNRPGTH
ncbi:MAG: hypothetical protein A3D65_04430 [Candidatus Lloydbacteria bacterium RIFCSPHIGHO2_02_FULL_50_13]|uniref:Uncharacterized protein n=1 Tax=Candidatus Lloydbacteria bacterium RIFCSPHIGHO2_02_FULL_50_13 TaxID=1798661 RepID=A0A1G2D077_9BACT|nr:MAG: hypothetical protein A3D65_04430 [Candidatus Lloydbacteria bacterium RIFCSPHIGHO2_02_FULL_50_13]